MNCLTIFNRYLNNFFSSSLVTVNETSKQQSASRILWKCTKYPQIFTIFFVLHVTEIRTEKNVIKEGYDYDLLDKLRDEMKCKYTHWLASYADLEWLLQCPTMLGLLIRLLIIGCFARNIMFYVKSGFFANHLVGHRIWALTPLCYNQYHSSQRHGLSRLIFVL